VRPSNYRPIGQRYQWRAVARRSGREQDAERGHRQEPHQRQHGGDAVEVALCRRRTQGRRSATTEHVRQTAAAPAVQQDTDDHTDHREHVHDDGDDGDCISHPNSLPTQSPTPRGDGRPTVDPSHASRARVPLWRTVPSFWSRWPLGAKHRRHDFYPMTPRDSDQFAPKFHGLTHTANGHTTPAHDKHQRSTLS